MQNSELEIRSEETEVAEETQNSELEIRNEEETEETQSSDGGAQNRESIGGKAHLSSSVPRVARVPQGALSKADIAEMRNILGNLDDAEIQRLYKRVTK